MPRSEAKRPSPLARVQRRPYRYALALVITTASLITLVLLSADHSTSAKDKLTQIGTGLAASIIFAVIYTVLANREYAELIRAEIADQLDEHLDEVLTHIKQLNQVFLPTNQYPATREFDSRFNHDLTRDLCNSRVYFFRGTSAKYVPTRLRECDHHLEVTQVMLLDPRDESTIFARASDRRRRPGYEKMTNASIVAEIRAEILLAVVALFDCRDACDIELGFSASTSPVRIEVFDDAIYTSVYRSSESQRNTHPETARFGRDSQIYEIFRDECRRQLQLAAPLKRFNASDTDDQLREFLELLGYAADLNLLEVQRTKYREFIVPFSTRLNTGA